MQKLAIENSKLKSEVEQLKAKQSSQLALHQQELENNKETITSLKAREEAEEAVIARLKTTNRRLKEMSSLSEARAVSLSKEVEDANSKLTQAAAKIDQLVWVCTGSVVIAIRSSLYKYMCVPEIFMDAQLFKSLFIQYN